MKTLMNKVLLSKSVVALSAFLILSVALGLSFKDKTIVSSHEIPNFQLASVNTSNKNNSVLKNSKKEIGAQKIDLKKAAKASGLSPQQINDFLNKVNSGAITSGSCVANVGAVSVGHASCKPAGPGRCTGDPKHPGKNLCPCAVSGTQGGSVQAICWQGCCRAISATDAKGAIENSGLTQDQLQGLGMLTRSLGGLLKQFMGGSGSGSGGGYDWSSQRDIYNPSLNKSYGTDMVIDTPPSFADYHISDNSYTSVTKGSSNSETEVLQQASSTQTDNTDTQTSESDNLLETVLLKDKERNTSEQEESDTQTHENNTLVVAPVDNGLAQNNEIQEVNQEDTYNFEFQDIRHNKQDESKVAFLRDPSKSKVYEYKPFSPQEEKRKELESKSWWQRFIDWMFGN